MERGRYAKGAAREAQIVAAATQLFSQRGFRGVPLREIAAAAEVSHPTLLHYFPTKEDLFMAVMRDWSKSTADSLEGLGGPHGLPDFVRDVTARNETIPGIVALYTVTVAEAIDDAHPAHEYYSSRFTEGIDAMTEAFEKARRDGLLRPGVDPRLAAQTLFALQDGAQVQWLYHPASTDVQSIVGSYLGSIMKPAASAPPAAST